MTIETKYSHKQIVFLMYNNMVVEREVVAVKVTEYVNNINYPIEDHIYYNLYDANSQTTTTSHPEKSLFPSREELIKSL